MKYKLFSQRASSQSLGKNR